MSGVGDVVQISAARSTTCALDGAGVVRCWGSNDTGQLGLRESPALVDYDRHATPEPVATTATFSRVDVGERTACAVSSAGGAVCWGADDRQQLGRPGADRFFDGPGSANLLGNVLRRTGGTAYTSFGLTADGGLLSWGLVSGFYSASGRLSSINPNPLPGPSTLSSITSFAEGESKQIPWT